MCMLVITTPAHDRIAVSIPYLKCMCNAAVQLSLIPRPPSHPALVTCNTISDNSVCGGLGKLKLDVKAGNKATGLPVGVNN